jgi:hypothetical protein
VRAIPKEASFIICGAPRGSAAAGNATSPQKLGGRAFSVAGMEPRPFRLDEPRGLATENRPDEK